MLMACCLTHLLMACCLLPADVLLMACCLTHLLMACCLALPLQVLEVACGVWHTAAIVLEPEGSPLPPQLQPSPLKAESPATFALPPSGSGDVVGALPGLPPASPAHRGAAHTRNNSTSSALSEVCGWRVKDMSQAADKLWRCVARLDQPSCAAHQ